MSRTKYLLTLILGLALVGGALFWLIAWGEPLGALKTLPYIAVGCGCGLCGWSAGGAATAAKRHLHKQEEIESGDERNIALSNMAKAKAFNAMLYLFAALLIALTLLGASLTIVLPAVGVYLAVIGVFVYYRLRYEKRF